MRIETFKISFESTQNNQQYGTKITCTEVRKKIMVIRNLIQLFVVLTCRSHLKQSTFGEIFNKITTIFVITAVWNFFRMGTI